MSEYSNNDYRDYLEHSWGKKPEQKAKESAYNHMYWLKNKAQIMAQRAKTAASNTASDIADRLGAQEKRDAQDASKKADDRYQALRNQGKTHSEATDDIRFRQRVGQAAYLKSKYNKTPMGRAESFANAGRSILNRLTSKAYKVNSAVDFHAYSDAEKAQRKAEREADEKKNGKNIFSLNIGGKSAIEIRRNKKG